VIEYILPNSRRKSRQTNGWQRVLMMRRPDTDTLDYLFLRQTGTLTFNCQEYTVVGTGKEAAEESFQNAVLMEVFARCTAKLVDGEPVDEVVAFEQHSYTEGVTCAYCRRSYALSDVHVRFTNRDRAAELIFDLASASTLRLALPNQVISAYLAEARSLDRAKHALEAMQERHPLLRQLAHSAEPVDLDELLAERLGVDEMERLAALATELTGAPGAKMPTSAFDCAFSRLRQLVPTLGELIEDKELRGLATPLQEEFAAARLEGKIRPKK